jgi:abortive infection bacteriophage resistance protein
VKFDKPALSLPQQLDLLIRRGMTVRDRDRALHALSHISYYRLRAYWLSEEIPTTTSGDHAFRRGVDFDNILDLYSFDRKLRLLVMDAIERVEVSLRTRWAYILGTQYGAHAYEDPALFRSADLHRKCLASLDSELNRSHETFIRHYRKTYTDPRRPPLWVVCEVLSFGQLSMWFANIARGADRQRMADAYGVDEQIIKSFAHHLTYVRNVCAHHSRLWNREMTIAAKLARKPNRLRDAFNPGSANRIYNTLVLLAHFVNRVSPGSAWHQHLRTLLAEHRTIDLSAMGFPTDWAQRDFWTQAA